MLRRTGVGACLALALLYVLMLTAGRHQETRVLEVDRRKDIPRNETNTIVYELAVAGNAGWRKLNVAQAIDEAEAVFAQCGVRVIPGAVHWLTIARDLRELEESAQRRLLAVLPQRRPLVLLVDRSSHGDIAYSYLASAPVASRGTAWITRESHPACVGVLLAHELGHILLNTARHSSDAANLMFHTCTVSNVAGSRAGTDLTRSQCNTLRRPAGADDPDEAAERAGLAGVSVLAEKRGAGERPPP